MPDAAATETLSVKPASSKVLFDFVVDICVVFRPIVSSNQQFAVLNLGDFLSHLYEDILEM